MDESRVQRLEDLEAIRDLARRYAHCVWQKDAAGAVDLFAENAVMDMGDRDPIVGRDALLESYTQTFATSSFLPFVHNHVIAWQEETATGTVYLDLRSVAEGKAMTGHGYYEDLYVRENGKWKFRARKLNLVDYREV